VTRGKYYTDKICTNIGGSKKFKDYNKKRSSIVHQRTKIKKLGNLKNEKVEKT